jgi:adenylyl cyclase-associated protein
MVLLRPVQGEVGMVVDIKDRHRGSPFSNQLSAVAESIGMVAWITVENKPFKHIEESLGSAQYFGNRVLKEFKDK